VPSPPRQIQVRNIAGVAEVLKACGGIPRSTLIRWRKQNAFPRPVKRLKSGELWDLAQVREWLEARNPPDTTTET
jgi:predicted DNA-binding transcriptional regulator AlpA